MKILTVEELSILLKQNNHRFKVLLSPVVDHLEQNNNQWLILLSTSSVNSIEQKIINNECNLLENIILEYIREHHKNIQAKIMISHNKSPLPTNQKNKEDDLPTKKQITIPNVARTIAVCSSKGGVGKSTMSLLTALSLHQQGYKVALVDLDIYGSSIPLICSDKPQDHKIVIENNKIQPYHHHVSNSNSQSNPIQIMSMGFLVDNDLPLMWRGPMLNKSISQLLFSVNWQQDIDYMIIDTPPGSGDVHISLFSNIKIDSVLLVSTPHPTAVNGVVKLYNMIEKFNIKTLGIIENMSSNNHDPKEVNPIYQNLKLQITDRIPLILNLFHGQISLEKFFVDNQNYLVNTIEKIKLLP